MMKYVFFIVLVLIALPLLGQNKELVITLEYQWEKSSNQNFFISKVIDNRPIKDNIGYVLINASKEAQTVHFKDGFEEEIQRVCNKILPYYKIKRELHLRINRLWVSATPILGVMEISVEFLEKVDDSFVSIGSFHQMIRGSGPDLFKKHQRHIRKGIRDCIEEFSNSTQQPILDKINRMDFSFGLDSNLTVGIYRSFNALETNQPEKSIGTIFLRGRKEVHGVKRYVVKYGKKKKRIKEYAYFDGKNLLLNGFILGGNSFDFLRNATSGPYLLYTDRYKGFDSAYYMFGLLGEIVEASSTRIRSSILNVRTGMLRIVDYQMLRDICKGNSDLLSKYDRSEKSLEDLTEFVQSVNDRITSSK